MKRDKEFANASHEQEPVLDRESPEQEFDIVEEASIESFPASDAPAWISRDTRRTTAASQVWIPAGGHAFGVGLNLRMP